MAKQKNDTDLWAHHPSPHAPPPIGLLALPWCLAGLSAAAAFQRIVVVPSISPQIPKDGVEEERLAGTAALDPHSPDSPP